MCTAITFQSGNHYFGRNLDLEYSYQEAVVVTPRDFPLPLRRAIPLDHHFAFIGTATVSQGYPLYYDGTNERGLSIAALNFPGNAVYHPENEKMINLAPYELIPWILGKCATVEDALQILPSCNLLNMTFHESYPIPTLHWIISDKKGSITVEPIKTGLSITENPFGVLTNNPPFDFHIRNLSQYMNLTSDESTNRFSKQLNLESESRGTGAVGMPGDASSPSRFIRAVFNKFNSVCKDSDSASISQFFHILSSVSQVCGTVKAGNSYVKTVYSSCCNTDKGIYYYKTYENSQITGVQLHGRNLDSSALFIYPFVKGQQIRMEQ